MGDCGLQTLWTADTWNTGDPSDLKRFLADARRRCSADRVALFLADHGHPVHGTCQDEGVVPGQTDALCIDELHDALVEQVAARGSVDLLVFASCQMGVLETTLTMADQVRYVVAGADYLWTDNFDYGAILQGLACRPDADGRALGEICLDTCRCVNDPDQVARRNYGDRQKVSVLSLIDTRGLPALGAELALLGRRFARLRDEEPKLWTRLHEMRARCMDFGCDCYFTPPQLCTGRGGCYVDLAHLARATKEWLPGVADAEIARVEEGISKSVLRRTSNPLFEQACGLAVMMPLGAITGGYAEVLPAALRPWLELLEAFEGFKSPVAPAKHGPRLVSSGGRFRFPGGLGGGLDFTGPESKRIAEVAFGLSTGHGPGGAFTGFLPLAHGGSRGGGASVVSWPHVVAEGGRFPLPVFATTPVQGRPDVVLAYSLLVRKTSDGRSEDVVVLSLLGPEQAAVLGVGRAGAGSLPVALELTPGDRIAPYDLDLVTDAASIPAATRWKRNAAGQPIVSRPEVRLGHDGLALQWSSMSVGNDGLLVAARSFGVRPTFETPAR